MVCLAVERDFRTQPAKIYRPQRASDKDSHTRNLDESSYRNRLPFPTLPEAAHAVHLRQEETTYSLQR